jgi:hypothetical protein
MSIIRLARGLLPALCAAMILMISVQANATAFAAIDPPPVVEGYDHQHHDGCGGEPLHAIGCCSVAFCAPDVAAAEPYAARHDHGLDLDLAATGATVPKGLFRPPRVG